MLELVRFSSLKEGGIARRGDKLQGYRPGTSLISMGTKRIACKGSAANIMVSDTLQLSRLVRVCLEFISEGTGIILTRKDQLHIWQMQA